MKYGKHNMMVRIWLMVLVLGMQVMPSFAQKIMAEGWINYKITIVSNGDMPGVADAFAGASQVLNLKGYKARVDFISPLRNQSNVYDAQTGGGFVIRQSGNDKYLIPLDQNNWKQYNKRFDGVQYTLSQDKKTVAGYATQKAVGKMQDGSQLTVYYATDLACLAKGYDLAFSDLPGLALEYEISSAGVVLRYEAVEVKMTMVSTATFEMPKSGYKVLDFKQ